MTQQETKQFEKRFETAEWVANYLVDGPKPVTEVIAAARVEGITERALKRAAVWLGVHPQHGTWALNDAMAAAVEQTDGDNLEFVFGLVFAKDDRRSGEERRRGWVEDCPERRTEARRRIDRMRATPEEVERLIHRHAGLQEPRPLSFTDQPADPSDYLPAEDEKS